MNRSPGKSRSRLHSHTHSSVRAPSLSARALGTALFVLAGAPVLPFLLGSSPSATALSAAAAPSVQGGDEPARETDGAVATPNSELLPIADALAGLGDPSFERREAASRDLLSHGAAALPALREALRSEDAEVRARAEGLIAQIVQRDAAGEARSSGSGSQSGDPLERLRRRALSFGEGGLELGWGDERVDERVDRALRRLDELFENLDRVTPPATEAFRERMGRLDHDLEARIAELDARVRRHFEQFRDLDPLRSGTIDERFFEGFAPFDRDLGGSGSARIQIWRNGERVLDRSTGTTPHGLARTFEFADVAPLGIAVESVHPSLRAHLPIPEGEGLTVGFVSPDSPAARAGLREYDVLLSIGGTPVTTVADLRDRTEKSAGSAVTLEVLRQGSSRTIEIAVPRERR